MFNFIVGLNVALLFAVVITSPVLPGVLTPEGEEIRQQSFDALKYASAALLIVSVSAYFHKLLPLYDRVMGRLPDWMTKDLTK